MACVDLRSAAPNGGKGGLTAPGNPGLIPRSPGGAHPCCRSPPQRASHGQVAQLVEQRTENPRVGGSIPPLATILTF